MKKYVKPDLFYENFELSQSVASCKVQSSDEKKSTNLRNANDCEYDLHDTIIFKSGNNDCTLDYTLIEDYCYQTGSGDYNFFSS